MTSLPKKWQNLDLNETKQIIYQSKGIDESYPKMYFLLSLSHNVKSYGHFVKFWPFYNGRSLYMVMSHDPRGKFRNFLFRPNSTFNIGKSHKISSSIRDSKCGFWHKLPLFTTFVTRQRSR